MSLVLKASNTVQMAGVWSLHQAMTTGQTCVRFESHLAADM